MSKFDLGLLNGDDWDEDALDATEAAINETIIGTEAERLALTPLVNGVLFRTTNAAVAGVGGPRVWWYDGTGWIILAEPPQTYTPNLANITLGNGSRSGWYQRSAGICEFRAGFIMGSTSAMGTGPTLSLPVNAQELWGGQLFCSMFDATAGLFHGVTAGNSSTVAAGSILGTLTTYANITATVPFTWAVNDQLNIGGHFRMQNRYS